MNIVVDLRPEQLRGAGIHNVAHLDEVLPLRRWGGGIQLYLFQQVLRVAWRSLRRHGTRNEAGLVGDTPAGATSHHEAGNTGEH